MDCKLFKVVLGKWAVIQFSPQNYERLAGRGNGISEGIKKKHDRLSSAGCTPPQRCFLAAGQREGSSNVEAEMLQVGNGTKLPYRPSGRLLSPSSQGRGCTSLVTLKSTQSLVLQQSPVPEGPSEASWASHPPSTMIPSHGPRRCARFAFLSYFPWEEPHEMC